MPTVDRRATEWDVRGVNSRTVRVTSPAPRETWWSLLEEDPQALAFQTPTWLDCICATGEFEDASRLYETATGARMILPMVRRRLPRVLATQASLPAAWGMGGLVARGCPGVDDLALVFRDLIQQPALRTSIRPNPLLGEAWAAARPAGVTVTPRVAHVLDLQGGFDRVWSERFPQATRHKIRKAERSGLVVECDSSGRLVPVFYALWRRSVDRWAHQQHEPRLLARWRARRRDPLPKFERIARRMGDACRVWVAWHAGSPAAAILVLISNNASYTRGAMDKALAGPTQANNLLHRLAIEDACRAGCRFYHMGETGSSTSLADFKRHLGARPYQYAEYSVERLPITAADQRVRGVVKRMIGFQDA
jgi:Acetyltransferase (GNAT) domain